ncbi:hypothetical protein GH714_034015 [Hevea brasiliensis]|uniref:Uncharacterized protein n=1 Tax=Hevea brasiliensis TaxID=3981 RepID=A0A6A6NE08_HEVBR|nr:hypothetical protein GH714_034015 [Hevea brasiliensis]
MNKSKPVIVSFAAHFKLYIDISPKIDEEIEHMSSVPYSSTVGSIMYVIVCSQPNILHIVSVVSRYMSRPGKSIGRSFLVLSQESGQDAEALGKQVNAAFGSSWKEVLSEGQLVEGKIHPGSPAVLITGTFASRAIELLRSNSSSFCLD